MFSTFVTLEGSPFHLATSFGKTTSQQATPSGFTQGFEATITYQRITRIVATTKTTLGKPPGFNRHRVMLSLPSRLSERHMVLFFSTKKIGSLSSCFKKGNIIIFLTCMEGDILTSSYCHLGEENWPGMGFENIWDEVDCSFPGKQYIREMKYHTWKTNTATETPHF